MWRLGELLFILCIALSHEAPLINVSGYEKMDVNISCPCDGYELYEKYLCRDPCRDEDVLIKTTGAKKGRYSTHDDHMKHMFTTTISDLNFKDSGRYWCGVTRALLDFYLAEVILLVVPDTCCEQTSTAEGSESGSVSITCKYRPEYQSHMKYFCRGARPSACLRQALVTSAGDRSDGRFTLADSVGEFAVTISSLTREDSGLYLCGVHTNGGLDDFSAVRLEVNASQSTTTPVGTVTPLSPSDTPATASSILLPVVIGVAALTLLPLVTLTATVVVVCRRKRRRLRAGDGVTMSGMTADAEQIYENQDLMRHIKTKQPQQGGTCRMNDDSDGSYENVNVTDNIYCNQMIHSGKERKM